MFSNLAALNMPRAPSTIEDELNVFLALPLELVSDSIAWWWECRNRFPNLSRMAIDYLSIPCTSSSIVPTLCY